MVEDIAREHPGQPIELWFQDEMRVGQKGTLTRVWAAKGERATAPRDLRFGYAYLFGAVCPVRDTGAAIVMPMVNTIAMNEHLIEIGRCVSPGAHAVLILDGAGWHPREGLAVPANITLLFLPTYSPELNPVEELWHELRRRFLANRVIDTLEDLIEACCNAWNAALHKPGFIKSVTGFSIPASLTPASLAAKPLSWTNRSGGCSSRCRSSMRLPFRCMTPLGCRLHRHQPGAAGGAYRRLLQPSRHLRAVHQRGQGRS